MENLQTILTTAIVQEKASLNLPDVIRGASEAVDPIGSPSVSGTITAPTIGIDYQNQKDISSQAIDARNVSKSYGAEQVLDNFSMKVPSGAIYSLLGSSGCGKTTILSCIVGLKKWDSGKISVLEHEREAVDSEADDAIPPTIRQRIGYMPQELALYEHLTVKEMIRYFGKLYGMSEIEIGLRCRALTKLLDLESKRDRQIQELSGGQKRRVSLALALVNKPDLLILDEPTVGLDPVLRRSIWMHLLELVCSQNTTVLITTHYIEETRYSNKIGIMRHGRMLTEENPQTLLSTYNSHLLQDAILQICRSDHEIRKSRLSSICIKSALPTSKTEDGEIHGGNSGHPGLETFSENVTFRNYKEIDPDEFYCRDHIDKNEKGNLIRKRSSLDSLYQFITFHGLGNMMGKSVERTLSFAAVMWIYLLRQPIFAFVLVFMPVVQLFMTFAVVGKDPVHLKVGVINYELKMYPSNSSDFQYDICGNRTYSEEAECELTFLSCPILNYLSENGKIDLVTLENPEMAEELLEQGSIYGYLIFPEGYSENLVNRHISGKFATDDETLDGSRVRVILEKSHYLAYHLITKEVFDSLENLSNHLDATCGFDHSYTEIPLHFREPVYGRLNGTHQDSIMPAIIAQILFEILYGIAPMILIKDLRQGTFDRASLAGLHFSEFMLGVFVTMSPILIVQSISCYLVMEYGLNFGVRGSLSLFMSLCILAGLCGQGFGIFMGILVKSEFAVIVSAIMIIPIIMTCSGTLWPLEAHPYYLKVIYYIFPSAPIVSSLRSVINRGVGLTHSLVWPGVLNALFYSIAFWMLSIYGYKAMLRR